MLLIFVDFQGKLKPIEQKRFIRLFHAKILYSCCNDLLFEFINKKVWNQKELWIYWEQAMDVLYLSRLNMMAAILNKEQ